MEFPVSVVVFDIRSVEKTYTIYKKKLLVNDRLFAVLSVYLLRNDINQVADGISFDSNKAEEVVYYYNKR